MYPAKPGKQFPKTKGHVTNDIDKCIFCGSCQRICPTQAIYVNKNDRTWEIDRMRCCTCNGCVETCPVKCLSMNPKYPAPMTTRKKDILNQRSPPRQSPQTRHPGKKKKTQATKAPLPVITTNVYKPAHPLG